MQNGDIKKFIEKLQKMQNKMRKNSACKKNASKKTRGKCIYIFLSALGGMPWASGKALASISEVPNSPKRRARNLSMGEGRGVEKKERGSDNLIGEVGGIGLRSTFDPPPPAKLPPWCFVLKENWPDQLGRFMSSKGDRGPTSPWRGGTTPP